MTAKTSTPGWLRALRIIFGVIAIAAAFFVLDSPGLAVYTLTLLLAFAMIAIGMSRMIRGLTHHLYGQGHRALDLIVGILGIILGFGVLTFPLMGALTLIFLLAFAAMVNGFGSIAIGTAAKKLSKGVRTALVILGLFGVVFAFIVFAEPRIGLFTLMIFLSISLMVHGVESIISAIR